MVPDRKNHERNMSKFPGQNMIVNSQATCDQSVFQGMSERNVEMKLLMIHWISSQWKFKISL
jgi:hypothetical protein